MVLLKNGKKVSLITQHSGLSDFMVLDYISLIFDLPQL